GPRGGGQKGQTGPKAAGAAPPIPPGGPQPLGGAGGRAPAIATSHDPPASGIPSRVDPASPWECSIGYTICMMRPLSIETTLCRLVNTLTRACEYAHAWREVRGAW